MIVIFMIFISFQESDWFILNENGQRERPMTEEEVADVKKMLLEEQLEEISARENNADRGADVAASVEDVTFSENAQLDYDDIIVGNPVQLSGGFLPIEGPVQPISDQLASWS